MSAWRKLRAATVIGAVSATFWAIAVSAVLAVVITLKGQWGNVTLPGIFYPPLISGGVVGFVGGVLYSLSLAGIARGRGDRGVGIRQGATIGGIVGAMIYLGVIAALDGGLHLIGMATLIQAGFFALLGAGTGAGILAAASRGKLPAGGDGPARLKGDR